MPISLRVMCHCSGGRTFACFCLASGERGGHVCRSIGWGGVLGKVVWATVPAEDSAIHLRDRAKGQGMEPDRCLCSYPGCWWRMYQSHRDHGMRR